MQRDSASFRDPSGHVFMSEEMVFRTIRRPYADHWAYLRACGLLDAVVQSGMLFPFEELPLRDWPGPCHDAEVLAVLRTNRLPFISYPYEWCFSQLRAAALLTLDMHLLALKHGCVLKDASAYNVQFLKGKPVFIDILSFERWVEGRPWEAYGQFCTHFLAPLALMSLCDVRCGMLHRQWIDGIPLDLASRLLPLRSRLSPSLAMHIHLHASMREKHGDARLSAAKAKSVRLDAQRLRDVAQSLRDVVQSLHAPRQATEWGNYYTDTNYTPVARAAKEQAVRDMAARHGGHLALDLGANTGAFSVLLAPSFDTVLATDVDHTAMERLWNKPPPENVLPLLLDLSSPSPAIGWACLERPSFFQRCRADWVSALALCHHLRITAGIPLPNILTMMASLLTENGVCLLEFVPKEDSQVQRLLSRREDIFDDYSKSTLRECLPSAGLRVLESITLPESVRTLYLLGRA
ncbi:MAG: hypothetical protein IJU76_07510 [Desulfovibrionaceae bacterium]|nr:hypothetical protein [Desulfovibrionaceae bacterium]